MNDLSPMNDLADAVGGMNHTITDDSGQLAETTATEEVPSEEKTPVTESEPLKEEQPKQETAETNSDVAEDEDGKKYVPEGRFKEVYAEKKKLERELERVRSDKPTTASPPLTGNVNQDRAAMLETELLNQTLPQFNPSSPEYSQVLDEMGAEIYNASVRFDSTSQTVVPTITKLEAARRALDRAKKLVGLQDQVRQEARIVKSQQSDSGITGVSRKVPEKKPEDMSLEEKEEYLKKSGQW